MNKRLVLRILGRTWQLTAVCMLLSLAVAFYYGDGSELSFLFIIVLTGTVGTLLTLVPQKSKQLYERDGFIAVALAWLSISILGSLPFIISGAIPNVIDALFESVSGFTTTGSSILSDIESLPRGILFWRSFTHWIGGMGVLVFLLAIVPKNDGVNVYLMRAESPGPSPEKLVPKLDQSAKILYIIYIIMTLLCIICLKLTGMAFFDCVVNAFGAAGTGGFSIMNAGIGAYGNPAAEIVLSVFMVLFGVNFSVYFMLIGRRIISIFRNSELRFYLGAIFISTAVVAFNIYKIYGSVGVSLRHAFFQISSIITTTGFSTVDYEIWPSLSKSIILVLMFLGASAGSTGGGVKAIRALIVLKSLRRGCNKLMHPRALNTVKIDRHTVDEQIVTNVLMFFCVYIVVVICGFILVSLDGLDMLTSGTAVLSAVGNIGPGLSVVGPAGNYSQFSDFSKIVLSLCMLLGRLEIFPLLILAMVLRRIPRYMLSLIKKDK